MKELEKKPQLILLHPN